MQSIGLASAGVGVAGSAVSGYGQYLSGQEQKAADDYNAQVALTQTSEKMQTTEADYSTLTGKQAALYAKAGVDVSSGSPLLVMAHTAAQGATQQESEQQAGTEQAQLDKYYGQVAAFTGTINGINTFAQGLAKGVTSAASIMGTNNPSNP